MKKLIAAVLLAALSLPAFAQEEPEQKWTVRASSGYFPTVPILVDLFGALFVGVAIAANEDANETLDMDIPPYVGLEAMYSFNSRWSAGVGTGYLGTVWKIVDTTTKDVKSISYLTFIPLTLQGRCNYLNRPQVKLYGSLEAGALFAIGSGDFSVAPDLQLNPIGVEFGSNLFGLVELGIGMQYTGIRAGIGYRF